MKQLRNLVLDGRIVWVIKIDEELDDTVLDYELLTEVGCEVEYETYDTVKPKIYRIWDEIRKRTK